MSPRGLSMYGGHALSQFVRYFDCANRRLSLGTYLRFTESKVRRGIGMVLQTLSVLVIVVDLIRRAISSP